MDFVSIARRRREIAVASLDLRQLELPGMAEETVWTSRDQMPVAPDAKLRTARPEPL